MKNKTIIGSIFLLLVVLFFIKLERGKEEKYIKDKYKKEVIESIFLSFNGDTSKLYSFFSYDLKKKVSEKDVNLYFKKIKGNDKLINIHNFGVSLNLFIPSKGNIYMNVESKNEKTSKQIYGYDYMQIYFEYKKSNLLIKNIEYIYSGGFPETLIP